MISPWSAAISSRWVCIATRAPAQALGLDFIPVQSERYDFVMRRPASDPPVVQNFLHIPLKTKLRRKLQVRAGYDTAQTGVVRA